MTTLVQLTLLCLTLLCAAPAWATIYWVATNGNNSNPGTEALPWATPNRCTSGSPAATAPGDICRIKSGTYNIASSISVPNSGTAGNPITYQGDPAGATKPILNFGTNLGRAFFIGGAWPTQMRYITLERLEITGGDSGIGGTTKVGGGGDHIVWRDIYFHDTPTQPILAAVGCVDCTIDRVLALRMGEHGAYLGGRRWTITNSVFGKPGENVSLQSSRANQYQAYQYCPPGPAYSPTRSDGGFSNYAIDNDHGGFWDSYIANNVFAYTPFRSGVVLSNVNNGSGPLSPGCITGTTSGNIYENNIYFDNKGGNAGVGGGVHCLSCGTSTNATVRNEMIWAAASVDRTLVAGTDPPIAVDELIVQPTTLTADPLFVNAPTGSMPASPNFRLNSGSPAINTGNNLTNVLSTRYGMSSPILDLAGNPRPLNGQGDWERGAYEFGGGGPPPTLSVTPSSLTFMATQGQGNPPPQTLTVTGNVSWTVTEGLSWLSVSPTAGSNNGTLTVSVNTATAVLGSNSGSITVTGSGLTQVVTVTLTLSAPPPVPPAPPQNPRVE